MSYLIMALATWRLTSLFVNEAGPFNMFKWLREKTGITHHDDGEIANIPERFWAKLLSCVWCLSIWMAIIVYFIYQYCEIIVIILAISCATIVIDKIRG